jgi:apolipoprotein N-acyltransferase
MFYFISIIAGLIGSTAFEPINFWFSAIASLSIWFSLLLKSNLERRVIVSYIFGLSLLLPIQSWTGIYVGNIPWLILCLVQAFTFIIPAIFVVPGKRFNQIAFACTFVMVELLLRTVPFTGFGWSRISFTQVDGPLKGLYSSGGVVLVAFFIAIISAARSFLNVCVILLIVASLSFIPSIDNNGDESNIALIQGGVSKLGLEFNSKPQEVFQRHLNQTLKSISKEEVDLIIWPENAVDVDINVDVEVKQQIVDLSSLLSTPVLVGGVTRSGSYLQNQSTLFKPEISQIYIKRYLTPFGEYLPLRKIASKVSHYANQIVDFKAGIKDTIFKSDSASFQTLICYELLDDSFRKQIDSDFLVVQTNNATFGDTAQLDQERQIARVRAIETGRFIAYVSTTGTTSFIDNKGVVIAQTPKFISATLKEQIPHVNGKTATQIIGKYLEYFAFVYLIFIIYRRRGI